MFVKEGWASGRAGLWSRPARHHPAQLMVLERDGASAQRRQDAALLIDTSAAELNRFANPVAWYRNDSITVTHDEVAREYLGLAEAHRLPDTPVFERFILDGALDARAKREDWKPSPQGRGGRECLPEARDQPDPPVARQPSLSRPSSPSRGRRRP